MLKVIEHVLEFFSEPNSYPARLDQFISSKEPKSVAEVEYWSNQFASKQSNWD